MASLVVKCGNEEITYYDLPSAAKMVCKDKAGNEIDGINSEHLRRVYREALGKYGSRIGRDLFFTVEDLVMLGFEVRVEDNNFFEIGSVVQLYPRGEE